MEGARLPKKAKTNQKSPKKRTVGDKNGQNTKMEASYGRTRELRSSINGRRTKWENPVAGGSLTCHPCIGASGTATGEGHACDDTWELDCQSSCLRWIDRLPTSRLVGISRRQGLSSESTSVVRRFDDDKEF